MGARPSYNQSRSSAQISESGRVKVIVLPSDPTSTTKPLSIFEEINTYLVFLDTISINIINLETGRDVRSSTIEIMILVTGGSRLHLYSVVRHNPEWSCRHNNFLV